MKNKNKTENRTQKTRGKNVISLSPFPHSSLILRPHNLLLKPFLGTRPPKQLGVHRQPRRHREAPVVSDLSAQVQVALCHENFVLASRGAGAAAAVGRGDVARPVKGPHVPVGLPAVSRGERVGERLGPHAVDLRREDGVGDRGVPALDSPERLAERPHGGHGVEDELGAVQREGLPVERVVAAVADVDADSREAEVEDPENFLSFFKFGFCFISFWVFFSLLTKENNQTHALIDPFASSRILTCARALRSRARRTSTR